MKFLHDEKFDVWAAAKRLAQYWETRRQVFGPDLAFKPMHQTGNGALTKAELEVLSSGFVSLLPKDKRGRSVLCFIPSRLASDKSAENLEIRRRCTFYIYSIILEISPVSQAEFSALMMTDKVGFQRSLGIRPAIEMMKTLPMYCDIGLIAHSPEDVDKQSFLGKLMPRLLQLLPLCSPQINVVAANSKQDLTDEVVEYGFEVESLPPEFGGTWTLEDFGRWQRDRIQLELRRESRYTANAAALTVVAKPDQTQVPSSAQKTQNRRQVDQDSSAKPSAVATFPTGRDKGKAKASTRIPDKVHSQRKRVRRKAKFNALQSAYSDVLLENKRLRARSRRLEKLLEKAKETVCNHEAACGCTTKTAEASPVASQKGEQGPADREVTPSPHDAGSVHKKQLELTSSLSSHNPSLSTNPHLQQQVCWIGVPIADTAPTADADAASSRQSSPVNDLRHLPPPPPSSWRAGGDLRDLLAREQPLSLPRVPFFPSREAVFATSMQPPLGSLGATNNSIQWSSLAASTTTTHATSSIAPATLASFLPVVTNSSLMESELQRGIMNNTIEAYRSSIEQQRDPALPTEQLPNAEQQLRQCIPSTNSCITALLNDSCQHARKLQSESEWALPLSNQGQTYCETISKRSTR